MEMINIYELAQACPEGIRQLQEEVTQMPIIFTPVPLPSLIQLMSRMASWRVLYNQLTEEKETQA